MCGSLPSLPYMCPMNLSRCCNENRCSPKFTPLHVSIQLITWLGWVYVELYLQSPTHVRLPYREAKLRIRGALPSLPYMCSLNFSSLGWVENVWLSTFTPLHVSLELTTWLCWEYVELYLHPPTCVHWTYQVAVLRICGTPPSPPYMCPFNLSRGWVESRWSPTFTPLHVSVQLIARLGWEYVEFNLQFPICVLWTYDVSGLRIGGAVPTLVH